MKSIDLVIDLQYGSTGKGSICGFLATKKKYDTIITAWAPNAGHTFIDTDGRKFVHTHIANGIVSPYCRRVLLGPGSVINPLVFLAEYESVKDIIDGQGIQIIIHPHAAVVRDRHVMEESGPMTKIGSTKKGVGAAMIQRIRRDPDDMNVAAHEPMLEPFVVTVDQYQRELALAKTVLIEGAQGFGLSLYHGFYPYTTSRDVSTWQILADCGIPFTLAASTQFKVIGTARTYPIRVANRFDDEGRMVGYSGPIYEDQQEISFADIAQEVELTTVTKLPRRLFTFSGHQIGDAVRMTGAKHVFLNFINYVQKQRDLLRIVDLIEDTGARVSFVGAGPTVNDVYWIDQFDSESPSLRRDQILTIWRKHHV